MKKVTRRMPRGDVGRRRYFRADEYADALIDAWLEKNPGLAFADLGNLMSLSFFASLSPDVKKVCEAEFLRLKPKALK